MAEPLASSPAAGRPEFSDDSLFAGRLRCRQPRQGYRFSLDPVLLAHFVLPKPQSRILDLGAGCGVISLILSHRWPQVELVALELQPSLAALLRANVELNGLQARLTAIEGDLGRIAELLPAGTFDLVVCNPPYGKIATGRANPTPEQAVARHEVKTDLAAVVAAVVHALRTKGRAAFVYPVKRGAVLLTLLKNSGLEPKRLQVVHSWPGGVGKLLLVEAVKGGGEELTILPPFYIYTAPGGGYAPEMAACYEDEGG